MQTITSYSKTQKEAKSTFLMGQAKERHGEKLGERIMTISTSKYNNALVTRASVSLHVDNTIQHIFSFATDKNGDFSKTLQQVPTPRATEKLILQAHQKALEQVGEVLEQARQHYS